MLLTLCLYMCKCIYVCSVYVCKCSYLYVRILISNNIKPANPRISCSFKHTTTHTNNTLHPHSHTLAHSLTTSHILYFKAHRLTKNQSLNLNLDTV